MTTSREKWIESEASIPLSGLARRAIAERFELINRHLPLAGKKHDVAVEDVHQLRVATRRATSALNVFGPLCAGKRVQRMKEVLRHIRRAAGEARDLDVLYLRLAPLLAAQHDRLAHEFLAMLLAKREAAQVPLVKLARQVAKRPLDGQVHDLLESVRWRSGEPEPTMAEAAHERLLPLIEQFYAAAERDLSDPRLLHKLRIAGKHLRYALELFAGAYDASLRQEVYPIFIDIQDRLGLMNDYETSQQRLRRWAKRSRGRLRGFLRQLIDDEQTRYDAQRQEFHGWWTPERARDMHHRFHRLLRQNGHNPVLAVVAE